MNNDLISRKALKKAIFEHCRSETENINHFLYDENLIALIDNAPTVSDRYGEGYAQGELADEVWKLYEKHHSHLATHVIEFGDELKELLDKYQKGGAE